MCEMVGGGVSCSTAEDEDEEDDLTRDGGATTVAATDEQEGIRARAEPMQLVIPDTPPFEADGRCSDQEDENEMTVVRDSPTRMSSDSSFGEEEESCSFSKKSTTPHGEACGLHETFETLGDGDLKEFFDSVRQQQQQAHTQMQMATVGAYTAG